VLHGDGVLHHERVFYGGEGEEDKVYSDGRTACDSCRDSGECVAGRSGVNQLLTICQQLKIKLSTMLITLFFCGNFKANQPKISF